MVQTLMLVGLIVILAASMPGAAQLPYHPEVVFDAEVTPDPNPVAPITGEGNTQITLKVTCEPPGTSIDPLPVNLRVETEDEAAIAILRPSVVFLTFDEGECLATPNTFEYQLDVNFSFALSATANEDIGFRLLASYQGEAERLVAEWPQAPGFFERWNVRFDQKILQSAQGEHIKIPGTIVNQGNGLIQVELLRDTGPELGEIVLPNPLKIPAGISDNSESFHIDYRGHDTGRDSVSIMFVGTSLDDPSIELEPTTERFVVQVEWDPVGEAPVVSTPMISLVLVGILVALRRDHMDG